MCVTTNTSHQWGYKQKTNFGGQNNRIGKDQNFTSERQPWWSQAGKYESNLRKCQLDLGLNPWTLNMGTAAKDATGTKDRVWICECWHPQTSQTRYHCHILFKTWLLSPLYHWFSSNKVQSFEVFTENYNTYSQFHACIITFSLSHKAMLPFIIQHSHLSIK